MVLRRLGDPDGRTIAFARTDAAGNQQIWTVPYAGQVADTLEAAAPGEPWVLVGHSLGGKVAMVTTLTHPDLVRSLVVVDIAPKDYGDLDRFVHYIEAMRALPLDELTGRADAEQRFAAVEPDAGVRGFLLQNLRRHGTTWSCQANLDLFARDAARGTDSQIADFPALGTGPYDGPVVWLVGGDSGYVRDVDILPTIAATIGLPLAPVSGTPLGKPGYKGHDEVGDGTTFDGTVSASTADWQRERDGSLALRLRLFGSGSR